MEKSLSEKLCLMSETGMCDIDSSHEQKEEDRTG